MLRGTTADCGQAHQQTAPAGAHERAFFIAEVSVATQAISKALLGRVSRPDCVAQLRVLCAIGVSPQLRHDALQPDIW